MMSKRIYIIISEEPVFHPILAEGLVRILTPEHKICGITLAIGDTRKIRSWRRLRETIGMFGPYAFLCLAAQSMLCRFFSHIGIKRKGFFSVRQVATHFKIPCMTSHNVNEPAHLALLRKIQPDMIISSNGHIFKKEILSIPANGCLNRHTALLPSYGGLWPVFWAMLHGEQKTGQTIHTMTDKIDEGVILAQEEIRLEETSTLYEIYARAFLSAPSLIKAAITSLEHGQHAITAASAKSYFGHPGPRDGREFRKKHQFFRFSELLQRVP